ncbi:unnamed protein product, partial [Ectocarpus sp. 12 AP-2014]
LLTGKDLLGTWLATAPSTSAPTPPRTNPLRRERELATRGFTKLIVPASNTGLRLGSIWARLAMCRAPNLIHPL